MTGPTTAADLFDPTPAADNASWWGRVRGQLVDPLTDALRNAVGHGGSRTAQQVAGLLQEVEFDEQLARRLRQLNIDLTLKPVQDAVSTWLLRTDLGALTTPALPHWHLDLCNATDVLLGRLAQGPIDWAASGVQVGHVDTGYTTHPVFGFGTQGGSWMRTDHVARSHDEPQTQGRSDLVGLFATHGTTSASIVGGYRRRSPADPRALKYCGMAPQVPMIPARVAQTVVLWEKHWGAFERAVRYLVDQGVGVINVSMGTFARLQAPEPIRRAVDYAYAHGVIVVAAAGNVPVPEALAYPAALPKAIAVAGVTHQRKPAALSSWGQWVDCSAPAAQVSRAIVRVDPALDLYDDSSVGTTLGTAMVSGAAALWLHEHAAQLRKLYDGWQKVEAFRHVLRASASPILEDAAGNALKPRERDTGYGAGILDVGALLAAPLPAPDSLHRWS